MALQPGDKLGPYEILALIGEGGMGEVWKARDTRLDRVVAIKRLRCQYSVRFEQEARAIAALNHPHICQIYDVGPDYLVLEYVEGRPIQGPLPLDEAVRLASQIAAALEAAHSKGILHRDLKPANILVTNAGVKLLDFGLAKLAIPNAEATQTLDGTVMGTPAYMSPEQAQARPLDARSDMFSFGAVLYEMISGRRAFQGGSMVDILSAVVRDEPAPLEGPLARLVTGCLKKQVAERFGSMAEVKAALVNTRPPDGAPPELPSIAVLPFANLSGDKEQEYFSDGLTEEIINLLAQISGLKVTARTSAFAFRGKEQDIKHIAEMLGVRTILEGSVRKAGNRIRITAQLIDATDGYHLWSRRFDAEMTDIFAVQDDISQAIVDTLKVRLMGAKPTAQRSSNIDAYHAYLKGRQYLWRVAPDQVLRAQACFEEAIALDPTYAPAYAGLAGCYVGLAMEFSQKSPHELMPLARAAALKAIQLDESKPEGHFWLARVAAQYDYDWTEAWRRYRLAVACGGVGTREQLGCVIGLLAPLRRLEEAIETATAGIAADPFAAVPRLALAFALASGGQPERAITELIRLTELHEDLFVGHMHLGINYASLGRTPDAIVALEEAVRLGPWHDACKAFLAWNYLQAGDRTRCDSVLATLSAENRGDWVFHILSGDFDRAAAALERMIEIRAPGAILVPCIKIFEKFCQSPQGCGILQKMNLLETRL